MSKYGAAREAIRGADAVLIGASNGLSISEGGYHIFATTPWFQENFGDFQERYGIGSPLEGMMYPFPTAGEKWAYFARLGKLLHEEYEPTQTMEDLLKIVADKDYFVVTTNGEDHFTPSGFDKDRVFLMEGALAEGRCSAGCTDEITDLTGRLAQIADSAEQCRVPDEMLPRCPRCGALLEPNLPDGEEFFHRAPFKEKMRAYESFVARNAKRKLAILELGIGARNQIIKAPLMRLASCHPHTTYIAINRGELYVPGAIQDQAICIDGDLVQSLEEICRPQERK